MVSDDLDEVIRAALIARAERGAPAIAAMPPHLAAMTNENGDVRIGCPRCTWWAQMPADPQGRFLHQLADVRLGHAAMEHPDLWEKLRGEEVAGALQRGKVAELQKRLDMILNSVRRGLDGGRISEREALEDIDRAARGETR